jgi:hypothetical protein
MQGFARATIYYKILPVYSAFKFLMRKDYQHVESRPDRPALAGQRVGANSEPESFGIAGNEYLRYADREYAGKAGSLAGRNSPEIPGS